MKLAYTAIDQSGQVMNDVIDADDAIAATEVLHRKGLFVSQIEAAEKNVTGKASGFSLDKLPGRKLKQLAELMRYLHVLLSSGSSVTQALATVERQSKRLHWRAAVRELRQRVEDGTSLAAAMEEQPEFFDPVTCGLIAAGESSGNIEEMLDRLARLKRRESRTRQQVIGALTYPVLVVGVSLGVVNLLTSMVLPRFSELFITLDVPLPASTQLLLTGGEALRSYWWVIGVVMVMLMIALWRSLTSDAGRRMIDTAMVRVPGICQITRRFITARVVRLLGVLLGAQVGLLESLRLTRIAAGNIHYAALFERAEEAAASGRSLSQAFGGSDLIDASVTEALNSGEQSGNIDEVLMTVADFMDEDNEVLLNSILSVIAPIILVLLGIFVGFVAISLFLPLFDLTAAGSGGDLP